jgi:agmatine deiminase
MIADREVNCVYLAAMLNERHPRVFADLRRVLLSHGIDVGLLAKVKDIWAKDYCPIQIGCGNLVKFRYAPDYLKDEPDLQTGDGEVKFLLGIGRCRRADIILDGGNIVASKTKAILTDKSYKENPRLSRSDLRDKLQQLLQVDQLIIIPKEPYDRIGHADGMVRFIDEHRILVNDYAEVDPSFGERLLKVLHRHGLATESLPYFHEKRSTAGIDSAVGCYTNFLLTKKALVAPVYGTKHDHIALRKLEDVFPGLPVIPLECTELAREGGVLNCVAATYAMHHGAEKSKPSWRYKWSTHHAAEERAHESARSGNRSEERDGARRGGAG